MENKKHAIGTDRLSTLECRVRLYHRMAVIFGLILLGSAGIAARNGASEPTTIRATRLEIVNDTGQLVLSAGFDTDGGTLRLRTHDGELRFAAHATGKGGRLEVLNGEGYERFSAGPQRETDLQGLWERHRHRFEQNTQQTNRLNQEMRAVESQLRTLEQQNRVSMSETQQQRDIDRLQAALDRHRRELDRQRIRLKRLDQQLRRIERR